VGVIVLDASVLIAFLDTDDAHHHRAFAAITTHRGTGLVVPASAYAETLVGPLRRGQEAAAMAEEALRDLSIDVAPVTREIAVRAARLRATNSSLRLPDTLVLATADVLEATAVLTADRAWQKISRRVRLI
jgi:predicted nucleic acid-binding protein